MWHTFNKTRICYRPASQTLYTEKLSSIFQPSLSHSNLQHKRSISQLEPARSRKPISKVNRRSCTKRGNMKEHLVISPLRGHAETQEGIILERNLRVDSSVDGQSRS